MAAIFGLILCVNLYAFIRNIYGYPSHVSCLSESAPFDLYSLLLLGDSNPNYLTTFHR